MDNQRQCSTCVWWQPDQPALSTGLRRPAGADLSIGACIARPPAVFSQAGIPVSTFPEVHADRVCGDWTPLPAGGPDGGEVISIARAA